jgi:hypothetical protein
LNPVPPAEGGTVLFLGNFSGNAYRLISIVTGMPVLSSARGMTEKISPSKGCKGELIRAFMMKLPTGAGISFRRLIIAESEFLDNAMDDLSILWGEIQNLEAGIVHV